MKLILCVVIFIFINACEDEDNQIRDIIIISPENNSTVSLDIDIECIIPEDIDKVELFINGESSNIFDDEKPFDLVWNTRNYLDGPYTIHIEGIKNNGEILTSNKTNITLYKTVELWGYSFSVDKTTEINLNNNRLHGSIPVNIMNLTNLISINLSYNQLIGFIPKELANLSNLENLNLSANQLSGSIPFEFGYLENLSKLDLSINQLTGAIPNTLNSLTKLEELNLSINQLTSIIPTDLDSLVNLKYLNLSSNELHGSIPASLGYLNNLSKLYLFRNNLSDLIPETVCNLIQNECQISVYDNQFCPPYFECLGDVVGAQDTSNCDQ